MSAEKSGAARRTWALLYQAAVYEADDSRRLLLIARATGAIERQHARPGSQAIEERQALQDAAYVLAALRKAAEFNLVKLLVRSIFRPPYCITPMDKLAKRHSPSVMKRLRAGDICTDACGLVVRIELITAEGRVYWRAAPGSQIARALTGNQSKESFEKRFEVLNPAGVVPKLDSRAA